MSKDIDNEDLEVKMGKAKWYASVFFVGAAVAVSLILVQVLYVFAPNNLAYYLNYLTLTVTTIYCLIRGVSWTIRYKRFRDQFLGLEPFSDQSPSGT